MFAQLPGFPLGIGLGRFATGGGGGGGGAAGAGGAARGTSTIAGGGVDTVCICGGGDTVFTRGGGDTTGGSTAFQALAVAPLQEPLLL